MRRHRKRGVRLCGAAALSCLAKVWRRNIRRAPARPPGRRIERSGHPIVFARALLEIAELHIKVARVLAPDDRRRRVLRHAVEAVARAAERRLLLDRIRQSGGRASEERRHNKPHATYKILLRARHAPICARAIIMSITKRAASAGHGEAAGTRRAERHSIVKAMMLLPRLELIWALPPEPTTMYCLPPTSYEDGGALTPAPVWNCHSTLPLAVS